MKKLSSFLTVILATGLSITSLQAQGIIRISESAFNPSAGLITFSEFSVGTNNPTYLPATYGGVSGSPTVNFGGFFVGQTPGSSNPSAAPAGAAISGVVFGTPTGPLTLDGQSPATQITGDSANPTSPVLSGTPRFNGPVSILFGSNLVAVGLTGGFFDNAGGTAIIAFDRNGNVLGSVVNQTTGIEFLGLATANGAARIAGLQFALVGPENAGFAIDNLRFGTADQVDIPGLVPDLPPVFVPVEFVDLGAISSLTDSGLPLATVTRHAHSSTSRTALRDVNGRIFRHRAGLNAASATTLSAPLSTTTSKDSGGLNKDGKYTLPVEPTQPDFKHFEIFASGDYGNQDVDRIEDQAGFEGDVWAGTVGVEFHANKNFTIGAAFTYASSDFDFSDSLGDIQIEGPSGSVYMSYATPSFYADVLYNYGSYDIETSRNPIFGQQKYNGETDSEQHNAELNLGYNLTLGDGKIVTGPIASLRFVQGDIEAYQEQTLGNAQIRYDQQTYESLISALGWQLSYKITSGNITIVPQVRAAWEHEYLDDADIVSAELVNSPFFVTTPTGADRLPGNFRAGQATETLGTDYLAAGAGVAILVGENLSFTLDYEGEFFRADSAAHYASVRASIRF